MGILLALVGVAVLAVAIIALHNPKSTGSNDAAESSSPKAVTPSSSSGTTASPTDVASSSGATATPSGNPVSSPADSASVVAAAKAVPLVVLNNTTITGLAATAAKRFEDGGWTVSDEGNLTNNIISTCAYYDPDVVGADKAARVLQAQYPTIKRVEPKFDGLPSGPVVVVLTPDYSAG